MTGASSQADPTEFSGACRCQCGTARLRVTHPPFTRFYCHCLICQRVYGRPFGDPTVTWSFGVQVEDPSSIVFDRQRSFPFTVSCGTCRTCRQPIVGYSRIAPFLTLAYIPSSAYVEPADVPAAAGHIFYAKRVADMADGLPKYERFAASQWGVARFVIAGHLPGVLAPRGTRSARRADRVTRDGASSP